MSILIKGIDLPEEGEDITLEINHKGEVRAYSTELKDTDTDTKAIQIDRPHGRLKDFDGNGIHPIIVDGVYMVKVDDLDEMPTILEAEE